MKKRIALVSNNSDLSRSVLYFIKVLSHYFSVETEIVEWDNFPADTKQYDAIFIVGEDTKEKDRLCKNCDLYSKVYLLQPNNGIYLVQVNGNVFCGQKGIRRGKWGREAFDEECYSEIEIERIGRCAFELAEKNNSRVVSIDKSDTMECYRLWRYCMAQLLEDYPFVRYRDELIDDFFHKDYNQCVLVTGDVLGDVLKGYYKSKQKEIMPYYSIGETSFGIFSSVFFTLPSYLCAVCMMFEESFGIEKGALVREKIITQCSLEKSVENIARIVLQ